MAKDNDPKRLSPIALRMKEACSLAEEARELKNPTSECSESLPNSSIVNIFGNRR